MAHIIELPNIPDYANRILALNPEKVSRFQCGGFFLSSRQPFNRVPPEAQMVSIHQAVLEGKLIDITDLPKEDKAWGTSNISIAKIEDTDTDKKVFFTTITDKEGRRHTVAVMTKDKEQTERIEKQLELTGKIDLSEFPENTGNLTTISGIEITDPYEDNKRDSVMVYKESR